VIPPRMPMKSPWKLRKNVKLNPIKPRNKEGRREGDFVPPEVQSRDTPDLFAHHDVVKGKKERENAQRARKQSLHQSLSGTAKKP